MLFRKKAIWVFSFLRVDELMLIGSFFKEKFNGITAPIG